MNMTPRVTNPRCFVVRVNLNLSRQFKLFRLVQPCAEKYCASIPGQIICLWRHPVPERGALAIVTNVGTGCDGRGCAFDERRGSRTAKSCGLDAPTLASSRREENSRW